MPKTTRPRRTFLCTAAFVFVALSSARAQGLWQDVSEKNMLNAMARTGVDARRTVVPQVYRTVGLNRSGLEYVLGAVPPESSGPMEVANVEIELPLPDGSMGRFLVQESPVMEPELAAKYPEIKTYVAQGIDDPAANARIDLTPQGFHAVILSPRGQVFIDPYWRDSDATYVVYRKSDYVVDKPFRCLVEPNEKKEERAKSEGPGVVARPTGATLRKYRLALACTGEYAAAASSPNPPTIGQTLGAMVTSVNRVNGVFERDFAIRLVLIGNNDLLVFVNPNTDGYTNSTPSSMLAQNQAKIDNVIGGANYDIGHVFGTSGGGVADLGVVCLSHRAYGVSSYPIPQGDPHDDLFAHELGHQFGAEHAFNSGVASCSSNRNASTAYEVSSGVSIMSYAGGCGPTDFNVTQNNDDFYNSASYAAIDNFISGPGGGCAQTTATGNSPPVIGALSNYTIPADTPFALAGSATDANGDTLTYAWEQFDLGPAQTTQNPLPNSTGPIFRPFPPSLSPTRYFPSLIYILDNANVPPATVFMDGNNYATGEVLPSIARTMNFRLTVRDNRAGGGGSDWAANTVTTVVTGSAFAVTSPNTSATFAGGSQQNVTWNVAGTTANGINCANVKVSLSTDGGNTFPTVLAATTPNDGSTTVTLPQVATTQGRIKVEAVGNIFFDISDANFTITSTNSAPTLNITSSITVQRGRLTATVAAVGTATDANGDPLSVSVSNLPYRLSVTPSISGGTISLSAIAECSLTTDFTRTYPITLIVTDSQGATTSGSVNVIITRNTPPTLGSYPDLVVNAGSSATSTPSATAADADGNLLAASYSVSPTTLAPNFETIPPGGTISINQTTGVVTVNAKSGVWSANTRVVVTVLDTCGAAAVSTFNLTVVPWTGPGSLETSFDADIASEFDGIAVATALQPDGKIIIGGHFTSVQGVARNNVARLNADGTLDMGFDPNPDSTVRSVAVQPDGKVLLGGEFTALQPNGTASSTTRNRVARIHADGTLDTGFNPNASGPVYSMALQPDGKVVLGGAFDSVDAMTRNRIARVNADGTLDTGFDPNSDNEVYCVAVQPDGQVVLGGLFTNVQGQARNYIARVSAVGILDSAFDPNAGGGDGDSTTVHTLAVQADGKILLGGNFSALQPNGAVSPTTRNYIARVNSDGTLDTGFDPNANGPVYSVAMQADGKLVLGGNFSFFDDINDGFRFVIARLHADGTLDQNFNADGAGWFRGRVFSVALQTDGKVLLAGDFAFPRAFLARLNSDAAVQTLTAPDTSRVFWSRGGAAPDVSQVTFELSTSSSGPWTLLGNGTRVGTTDWQLLGLSLPTNGHLRARGRTTDGITNGGLIEQIATYTGAPVNTVPTITPVGSARRQGSAASNTTIATVSDAESSPGSLVVTAITVPTGLTISNIVNSNGTITAEIAASCTITTGSKTIVLQVSDGALTANANLSINVLANNVPTLSYTNPASIAAGGSTTVMPATASDNGTLSFALQSQGTYTGTISVNSGTGVVSISNAAPVGVHTITVRATDNCGAIKDASFSLPIYDPNVSDPGTLDPLDVSIAGDGQYVMGTAVQPDGKTIIVGSFTSVLGVTRNNIARLNANGTLDMVFDPNADGQINSVALQADGKVLVGGSFLTLKPNGAAVATNRLRIARVNADGTLDNGFDPSAGNAVNCIALQPDGKIVIGGSFLSLAPNGGASVTRNRIARLNINGTVDSPFDPRANTSSVTSLAVQPDGKVVIGGGFTSLQPNGAASPTTRNRIARVNADGTLDTGFNPNAAAAVNCIALQPDGKVLLGGSFLTLQPNGAPSPTTRNRIARVNADGTLDPGFNPNAGNALNSIALQVDGKLLLAGNFTTLQPNGAPSPTTRNRIARVNADGTLDTGFDPNASHQVFSVALQADGKVLLGGQFISFQPNGAAASTPRIGFARINNNAATQSLGAPDTSQVLWSRAGAGPELSQVTFENSTNGGSSWTVLGNGTRVGTNWQLTGLSLPTDGHLRARGRPINGYLNGGSGLIEQVAAYSASAPNTVPSITAAIGLSRQQGTAASNSTIATVNDAESTPGSLTVTATNVPAGLSVSNIANNSGTITADVAASCAASTGDNVVVLQVSDGSLTATANLVINVTANSAPVLSYNNPAAIAYGGFITVNPATASDNGALSFAVHSPGSYTGTISVSGAGTVAINNAAPVGTHTITIRATDNCGSFSDASFMLTVNRRAVTVTADEKVKVKGDADPALTYVATGLVGSDTLLGALARSAGGTPGIYPISQGTVTDANNPNYAITFVSANLIITGPVASNDKVTRSSVSANSLYPLAALLANDSRVDSNGASQTNNLSITGVTAGAGNLVSISGAFVSYTPDNAAATGPLTFTYTLTDSVSGATDVGTVTVTTVDLKIVQIGTATYDAGTDTTSKTMTFATLPNATLNIGYSTNLIGWVAHTGNPVNSSPTGSLAVTFTASGNQTALWNSRMFFRAGAP